MSWKIKSFGVTLLFGLFLCQSTFTQVSLKGIKLGEKDQPDTTYTTVGGENGYIYALKLKDGRCYKIMFANHASFKDKEDSFSAFPEVVEVIKGFMDHFELDIRKDVGVTNIDLDSEKGIKGMIIRDKGNVNYFIGVIRSTPMYKNINPNIQLENEVYILTFILTNKDLLKLYEQEVKEALLNDY